MKPSSIETVLGKKRSRHRNEVNSSWGLKLLDKHTKSFDKIIYNKIIMKLYLFHSLFICIYHFKGLCPSQNNIKSINYYLVNKSS